MVSSVPSKGLEWTNLLLGIGLFVAAFSFGDLPIAAMNAAVAGLFIASSSTIALNKYNPNAERFNIAVGSWAIIAPFVLRFESAQSALAIHMLFGLGAVTVATMQLVAGRKIQAAAYAFSRIRK